MLIFITGGVRSGKSNFAQKMALDSCADPVYIATAKVWDDDFRERVERHQSDRGPEWTTFEAQHGLYRLPVAGRTVVIDCVTLWLTGFFMDNSEDIDACLAGFKTEVDQLCALPGTFILISNELGMGMHADTAAGRKFADLQGWANQYAAAKAEEVIFMVSGLPLYLKKR
jgi:adenosylcobinamide kinase/adenosylcobinamide-phosphate guanylyltransferase